GQVPRGRPRAALVQREAPRGRSDRRGHRAGEADTPRQDARRPGEVPHRANGQLVPGDWQRSDQPQGLPHRRAKLHGGPCPARHRNQRLVPRGALLSLRARSTRSAQLLQLALLLALVLPAARAHAYPWMIQHGYTNCSTCHVDPSGWGLLTEYGRAQAQIVLPTLWGGKKPEDIDPFPGILYGAVPLPSWLNVGLSLRGAVLSTTTSAGTDWRDILMIADLRAGITAGPFLASASFGYVPTGATLAAL